jgi:hypothetical protein
MRSRPLPFHLSPRAARPLAGFNALLPSQALAGRLFFVVRLGRLRPCRACVNIGIPHQNGEAISFPYLLIEFFARRTFDCCSVYAERIQPSSCRGLVEFWFKSLKGEIGNAATNAMATKRHEKIDVVVIEFAIGRLTSRRKGRGFDPLRMLPSDIAGPAGCLGLDAIRLR